MAVTARSGDTLSGLLKASGNPNYASPSEWAKYSSTPNMIQPGQVFNIPSYSSSQNFSPAPNMSIAPQYSSTPNASPANYSSASAGFFNRPTKPLVDPKPTFLGAVSSPGFVNGTPDWVKPLIEKASEKHNIPTIMLSSLLKQESGFNVNARSPVGATGIAQFMPSTAQAFGIDPLDPAQAIDAAGKYLRTEWDYFGKPELALAAYNAGRGNVKRYGGIPPFKETQNYVKSIMAMSGEPHASANQPVIDMQNEAKKQQEKAPQIQPGQNFSPANYSPAPNYSSVNASVSPRAQTLASQMTSPMYNDQGQRYMPGFWQGDWADRTGQAVEDRSQAIMSQVPPLNVKQNLPPQMRRFSINPDQYSFADEFAQEVPTRTI